jgi:HEAT repeat protein
LKDKDSQIRQDAVTGLVEANTSIQVTAYKEQNRNPGKPREVQPDRPEVKETAAALVKAGTDDKDPDVRKAAVAALSNFTRLDAFVPDITQIALKDEGSAVRLEAVRTLLSGIHEPSSLVAPMTQILDQEKDGNILQEGSNFFNSLRAVTDDRFPVSGGRPAGKDTIAALITALTNARKPLTRAEIIRALERIGAMAKDAVPALKDLLDGKKPETDPKVREAAADALKAIQGKP